MQEERLEEKKDGKSSFIAEARREQIIEAAIRTLEDVGYVKASLSQIAKRAGISTALISYHFADKEDLMNQLLINLVKDSASYVLARVGKADTPQNQLNAFIEASLAYQSLHPARSTALIEIVFNARTPDNTPYYKLEDDEEDPLSHELKRILREGQRQGVFGAFHVDVTASVIQGAIGEYMLDNGIARKVDLETYGGELIRMMNRMIRP